MQILDGASFGTSRVGPLLVSVVVFAHTRRAVEYKCEKKMESAIVQLAKEKTVSYSSHLSDCHNGSRVLGRLIIKGLTIVKKKSLHGCVHNIGGHTALHFLSGWPAKHNTRAH